MTYAEGCAHAATAQGLDPITEALRAAGIPHRVDQTGGFCMVVRVPLTEADTVYLCATAGEVGGTCDVGMYWDDCPEWHGEGQDLAFNLPIEYLAHGVRTLARGRHLCPHCQ